MDKRKYQRVVLVVGLLFLTILLCFITLSKMITYQRTEKSRIMGRLISDHPELEQELIDAFENPDNNVLDNDIELGKALEDKYGYLNKYGTADKTMIKSVNLTLLLLFITSIIIGCILIYYERRQSVKEEREEKVKDQLRESEKGKQLLLDKLTIEENNTKELITDISHQLKTPLASLKMSYEIAQSNQFDEEEKNMFLRQGRNEINKLESLLEALLNIARLEANMIQIKPVTGSLKKTLINAVNSVYMKACDKKIEIMMEEFTDILVIHDVKWTQEAFVNILDNAVKYSDSNTTISIKVTPMLTYAVIEIADMGVGITEKDFTNIFKRFYRGHSDKVQNTEGSGVGLYLSRKILEEQGGSICAKQGYPCGSVFLMTLQRALPSEYSYKIVRLFESKL